MLRVDVLLLDLVIVLAAAQLLGAGARLIGQPPVIGEILAGILLGPTVLGHWFGDGLFPTDVRPALHALADVGLVLFMFLVGMELDQRLVRGRRRVAASVALASVTLSFCSGCLLALFVVGEDQGRSLPFVLFFGVAASATAFPVLARILTDRGMHRIRLGGMALASAAIADVLVWTVLAIVIALEGAGDSDVWRVALVVPFAVLMFVVVRPQLRRLIRVRERRRGTSGVLAAVLLGMFGSAWVTEWMNVHFIFGAFLFGAVMPREGAELLQREIVERLEHLAVLLLLPMFFVVAGMAVDLTKLDVSGVGMLAAVLVVVVCSKLGGAYGGARLQRVPGREALALAMLMNTQGLTEIVILNVGLEEGLLDEKLYSVMVLVALITTAMTGPLMRWIYPDAVVARDVADLERMAEERREAAALPR